MDKLGRKLVKHTHVLDDMYHNLGDSVSTVVAGLNQGPVSSLEKHTTLKCEQHTAHMHGVFLKIHGNCIISVLKKSCPKSSLLGSYVFCVISNVQMLQLQIIQVVDSNNKMIHSLFSAPFFYFIW